VVAVEGDERVLDVAQRRDRCERARVEPRAELPGETPHEPERP
jgi:hypothetical protein